MQVIYSKDVSSFLNELIDILYEKEYFGFKESAYEYVDWLFEQIETSIHRKIRKPAPVYFAKYASNLSYVSYKRNSNTTWYVFFKEYENTYYVFYIGNNHSCSQYLQP